MSAYGATARPWPLSCIVVREHKAPNKNFDGVWVCLFCAAINVKTKKLELENLALRPRAQKKRLPGVRGQNKGARLPIVERTVLFSSRSL
jgi:hypothetical protein